MWVKGIDYVLRRYRFSTRVHHPLQNAEKVYFSG
jgi:hypothetical protein